MQTAAVTDWRAGFHLFGYNDKTPWSADSSRMLGLRTALSPRDLQPGDSAQIGLIPFSKGGRPCASRCSSYATTNGAPVLRCRASPAAVMPVCRGAGAGHAGITFAGKPVSQDRAGWAWEPLATTTAWNYQIGARFPSPGPTSPIVQQPSPSRQH